MENCCSHSTKYARLNRWQPLIKNKNADVRLITIILPVLEFIYHSLGELYALLLLINGLDLHQENIIANGKHPVLIEWCVSWHLC
ncbi:MAG: DUF4135 domain-containing protein [Legionellaceae bacterium]|nr:DUF4135 domain-containing protein [Legionellaceae bacterium]